MDVVLSRDAAPPQESGGVPSGSPTPALVIRYAADGVCVYQSLFEQPAGEVLAEPAAEGAAESRLHTICPYYTMFPLGFPRAILQRFARPGQVVLDPFCGRGTTLFAARQLGLRSVGIDSNPVAAAVSAAKLTDVQPAQVVERCEEILATGEVEPPPLGDFWTLCYHPQTLSALLKLRAALANSGTEIDIALRALLLGVLHGPRYKGHPGYFSNQMPRTYATKPPSAVRFWRRRELSPAAVDVVDLVRRRSAYSLERRPPPAAGSVWFADARHLDLARVVHRPVDWIITSPPYFGMRTYRPDQWLRNWFLGGAEQPDYRQDGQLAHRVDDFVDELAMVWRNLVPACRSGTRLVVRFGCLPSCAIDPGELLTQSLERAGHWQVEAIKGAGSAQDGRRQSTQFKRQQAASVAEIDLYAKLR